MSECLVVASNSGRADKKALSLPPGVSYRMKSEGKVFFLCREVRASRQRGQRVVAGVEDSRCTIHVNFGTTQIAGIFITSIR